MIRTAVALTLVGLIGCGKGDVPDPEILSFEVDPSEIPAGSMATVTIEVENFAFSEHHTDDPMTMGVDHGDEDHDAGDVAEGHVHVYLDDLETNPLVMMMSETAELMIPMDTTLGAHTLIARLHDADHLILEPQTTAEVDITVVDATMTGTMR